MPTFPGVDVTPETGKACQGRIGTDPLFEGDAAPHFRETRGEMLQQPHHGSGRNIETLAPRDHFDTSDASARTIVRFEGQTADAPAQGAK